MTTPDAYVEIWGAGESIVLVHGANVADPARYWAKQRPLAERWQLVVLHRRGYGANPAPARADVHAQVGDVLTLLDDGAHLVGHSFGGLIALLVAARRPQAVKSLVLIEPTALAVARGHPAVEALITQTRPLFESDHQSGQPRSVEAFYRGMLQVFGVTPPRSITLSPAQRRALETTMVEPPPWDVAIPLADLAQSAVPTLLITGGWHPAWDAAADALTPPLRAERVVITGRGHDVHQTGEPFNQAVEAFLQQVR